MLALLSPLSLVFLAAATAASIFVGRARSPLVTRSFVAAVLAAYAVFLLLNLWGDALSVGHWVLPFAMAYSTLRLIHYALEADRGSLGAHSGADVIVYQFFPAALAVGPINRFGDFQRDLRRRRWDPELFSTGLTRILTGAVKIVILGNFIVAQLLGERIEAMGGIAGWYLRQLHFWLSLYIQFSGYTDVAIGAGACLGFRLPENFNFPFVARNIGDFWRRWHITLANWCRDYVYMPVLARWRSTRMAMTASMLTIGLWHEASIHYVLWGLYHAFGLTTWRAFEGRFRPIYDRQSTAARRAWTFAAWVVTIHFVVFSYTVTTWIEQKVRGS